MNWSLLLILGLALVQLAQLSESAKDRRRQDRDSRIAKARKRSRWHKICSRRPTLRVCRTLRSKKPASRRRQRAGPVTSASARRERLPTPPPIPAGIPPAPAAKRPADPFAGTVEARATDSPRQSRPSLAQRCAAYAPVAARYCAEGVQLPPEYAPSCARYKANCRDQRPAQPRPAQSKAEACAAYAPVAARYCSGGIQLPPEYASSCARYRANCPPSSSARAQPQPRPVQSKAEACAAYAPTARKHCVRGRRLPAQLAASCARYQRDCLTPSTPRATTPRPGPPRLNPCTTYARQAQHFCRGGLRLKEREEKFCRDYRAYCARPRQEKGDLESIADIYSDRVSFGPSTNVGGIPFYPFNPTGSIGVGEQTDIDFGTWGGGATDKFGVADFWQQSEGGGANWHEGEYGGKTGFGVPLFGGLFSGGQQNLVKVPINEREFGEPIVAGQTHGFGPFYSKGDTTAVDWMNGNVAVKDDFSLPFLGFGISDGPSIAFPSLSSFAPGVPLGPDQEVAKALGSATNPLGAITGAGHPLSALDGITKPLSSLGSSPIPGIDGALTNPLGSFGGATNPLGSLGGLSGLSNPLGGFAPGTSTGGLGSITSGFLG